MPRRININKNRLCNLRRKDYPIKRLYEAAGVIAGEEDLLKIETLALRKGKIEEDERLIYDNLGNIVVI